MITAWPPHTLRPLLGAHRLPRLPLDEAQGTAWLQRLATRMAEPALDPEGSVNRRDPGLPESLGLPCGYSFLWALLENDLAWDPPGGGRVPQFNLDSLYGGGPQRQPYLYAEDGARFLLGRAEDGTDDLPRNAPGAGPARALIAQAANDADLILAQLHLALLKFHNAVCVQLAAGQVPAPVPGASPADAAALHRDARNLVCRHLHWVILEDLLPRLVGPQRLQRLRAAPDRILRFDAGSAFVPAEFALAASATRLATLRFDYDLNGLAGRGFRAETQPGGDLRGGRRRPAGLQVEWHRFFTLPGYPEPAWAMPFDTGLCAALQGPAGDGAAALLLLAGHAHGLASGQALASHLGVPPDLRLGLADGRMAVHASDAWQETMETEPAYDLEGRLLVYGGGRPVLRETGRRTRVLVTGERDELLSQVFGEATPLWYYLLREAQVLGQGLLLGPLGGRLLAETVLALLEAAPVGVTGGWTPTPGVCGAAGTPGRPVFGMAQLLAFARAPL